MQSVRPALPEFDGFRLHPIASPERWQWHFASAELRLEALPRIEAEAERLRAALEAAQARATAAEQLAAVNASELKAAERRAAEAEAREQAAIAARAEAEKQTAVARLAEQQARTAEQTAQARLESVAQQLDAAHKVEEKTAESLKICRENAAELRGRLAAIEAKGAAK